MTTPFFQNWFVATPAPNGVAVFNSLGGLVANTGIATSSVVAAFVADHQLAINIGGTTYYFAASTVSW